MSELQFGLLAIGAIVVAAVLAYNKWQDIKFRRHAERSLEAGHDDVLMGVGIRETTAPDANAARAQDRVEPTFEAREADPAGADSTAPGQSDPSEEASLAEEIDFIVSVEAADEIDGEALLDASAAPLAGFSKPVRLEGFDAASAKWGPISPGARYTLLRAGLQLVDRRGPVHDDELTTFGAGVQQAAAVAGALATIPDRSAAMARAAELDEFCGQVDILVAMHITPAAAPFAGTKVRALAEANAFVLDSDGRFRRRDESGRVMYELASMDATPLRADTMRSMTITGITLELDVPRAPNPTRAFEQFRDLVRQLANVLGGNIVDENRATVSPAAFAQILAQIQAVQRAMSARAIPPGSPLALRLFS
jgi:hypothetical protein